MPEREGPAPGESLLPGMKSLAMALLPEVTLCAEANVDVKRAGRALGIVWLLRCPPAAGASLGRERGMVSWRGLQFRKAAPRGEP